MQGAHNAARKLLDGLHYVADTVTSVGAKPTKVLADWMTDQIAPSYWIPNALIAVSSLTIFIFIFYICFQLKYF